MGILSSMVNALRSFYPTLDTLEEEINITMTRLLAKVRTMAAMSYKISRGHELVLPRPDLTYCENFLNMMFDTPVRPYEIKREVVSALRVFWILHADHEQNCSTSSVRMVGSARVNLYAAISQVSLLSGGRCTEELTRRSLRCSPIFKEMAVIVRKQSSGPKIKTIPSGSWDSATGCIKPMTRGPRL